MRTTLTLEPDVAAGVERLREERGMTLKAAVNEAIRRGLAALAEPGSDEGEPYRIVPWDGGEVYLENIDDVAEVLAYLEGEAFK